MSDLRALVRFKEKELRRLEWSLLAHKAQEATGTFVPEDQSEQQVWRTPPRCQGETNRREQDFGLL